MTDPFLAEIRIFGFNFAPSGWAACNGQLMPISQNTALFSLLGTTYGGDGKSTFALPNLQGMVPMHFDQGPGLSMHVEGETGGSPTVTLLSSELPAHPHTLQGYVGRFGGDPVTAPAGNVATETQGTNIYDSAVPSSPAVMNGNAIAITGGNLPHNNLMPYLTFTVCIALQGIYPQRS